MISNRESVYRFLWKPIKICTVRINNEEARSNPDIFNGIGCHIRDLFDAGASFAEIDIKINNDDFYFTLKGNAKKIGSLSSFLPHSTLFEAIFRKAINDPSSVEFQASLNKFDLAKLYEMHGRHVRKYLNDEQFKAIYQETLRLFDYKEYVRTKTALSNWLSDVNHKGNQTVMVNKYDKMYLIEEELLENKGLLDSNLVQEQSDKIKSLNFDYYLIDENLDYLVEFMQASKKKNIFRNDVALIRDNLDGGIDFRQEYEHNIFRSIFSKKNKKDLELEF